MFSGFGFGNFYNDLAVIANNLLILFTKMKILSIAKKKQN